MYLIDNNVAEFPEKILLQNFSMATIVKNGIKETARYKPRLKFQVGINRKMAATNKKIGIKKLEIPYTEKRTVPKFWHFSKKYGKTTPKLRKCSISDIKIIAATDKSIIPDAIVSFSDCFINLLSDFKISS